MENVKNAIESKISEVKKRLKISDPDTKQKVEEVLGPVTNADNTTKVTSMIDSVYLGQEMKECPRSTGEIVKEIPLGEAVTLQSDALLALWSINSTGYFTVWSMVKRK